MTLWTPANLPAASLGVWYDASDTATLTFNDSTVAQISDKSGNGRNAVQATAANQPALGNINGRQAIGTDATGRWMAASLGSATYSAGFLLSVFRRVSGGFAAHLLDLRNSASVNPQLALRSAGFSTRFRSGGGATTDVAGPAQDTAAHIAMAGWRNGEVVYAIDGVRSFTAGSFGNLTLDTLALLSDGFSLGTGMTAGYLGEALWVPGDLALADRQLIEGYLAWKWGLQANLATGHPWKNGAPLAREATAATTILVTAAASGDIIAEGAIAAEIAITGSASGDIIDEGTIAAEIPVIGQAFGGVLTLVRPRYLFVVPPAGSRGSARSGWSFTAEPKDPEAVLEYEMDWSRWLAEGETLVQPAKVRATGEIDVAFARVVDGRYVRWRLSGGVAGEDCFVTVTADTSSGQTDERTIRVPVRER